MRDRGVRVGSGLPQLGAGQGQVGLERVTAQERPPLRRGLADRVPVPRRRLHGAEQTQRLGIIGHRSAGAGCDIGGVGQPARTRVTLHQQFFQRQKILVTRRQLPQGSEHAIPRHMIHRIVADPGVGHDLDCLVRHRLLGIVADHLEQRADVLRRQQPQAGDLEAHRRQRPGAGNVRQAIGNGAIGVVHFPQPQPRPGELLPELHDLGILTHGGSEQGNPLLRMPGQLVEMGGENRQRARLERHPVEPFHKWRDGVGLVRGGEGIPLPPPALQALPTAERIFR